MSAKIPKQKTVPEMPPVKQRKIKLDPNNENVGAVLISAVRYACGSQTYMPSLVIDVVRPMLPLLTPRTVACMERDIREADKFGGYGDEKIDKPMWLKFLAELQKVMEERGIEKWQ